jgi:hypothetical protein
MLWIKAVMPGNAKTLGPILRILYKIIGLRALGSLSAAIDIIQ